MIGMVLAPQCWLPGAGPQVLPLAPHTTLAPAIILGASVFR